LYVRKKAINAPETTQKAPRSWASARKRLGLNSTDAITLSFAGGKAAWKTGAVA